MANIWLGAGKLQVMLIPCRELFSCFSSTPKQLNFKPCCPMGIGAMGYPWSNQAPLGLGPPLSTPSPSYMFSM